MPDDGNKSLADKLASYRSLLLKANAPLVGDHPQDIASPGVKSAPPPADRADPSRPPVLTIEHRFPTAYRHGHYRFDRLNEVFEAWPDLEIDHPLYPAGTSPKDLLFFDTETTGLQRGPGNIIFLLGYAQFQDEEVVVRQHFLTSPSAEVGLYQTFFDHIQAARYLVTYNGKSFDWPQVQTRHTLLRSSLTSLPSLGHVDLLHPSRRLWADDLESCRLANVESQRLNIHRQSDTPGHMAPILYFDYLRRPELEIIQGILTHNQWDVLSLITLYIHLSVLVLNHTNSSLLSPRELLAISRWYEQLGGDQRAQAGYEILDRSAGPFRVPAKMALGRLAKRQGDWGACLHFWESCLAEQALPSEELLIEISKIYEHRLHDPERALGFAERAVAVWEKKQRMLRHLPRIEGNPHHQRLERLRAKRLKHQI